MIEDASMPKSGEQEDQTAPRLAVEIANGLRDVGQEPSDAIAAFYAGLMQGRGAARDLIAQLAVGNRSRSAKFVFGFDGDTIVIEPLQVGREVELQAGEPLCAQHSSACFDRYGGLRHLDTGEIEHLLPELIAVGD
jgi:hypothetical protein